MIKIPTTFKVNSVDAKIKSSGGEQTKKRGSLFARKMAGNFGTNDRISASDSTSVGYCKLGETSRVLATVPSCIMSIDEKNKIHQENMETISAMTIDEITAAKNELMSSLSRSSIEYFRTKVKKESPPNVSGAFVEADVTNHDKKDNQVVNAASNKKPKILGAYLNMDTVEEEKMEWMKDIPQIHQGVGKRPDEMCTARFNFEGFPVPYDALIPVQHALHHHGDEPSRAGYSIEELLMLSRSTNTQQKVIAINTLCKVILQFKRGYFDAGLLDQNIIDKLTEHDFVLILRTSLDDTVESIRECALSCLRQLLDNQYDELVLDKEYSSWDGHIQPSVPTTTIKNKKQRGEFENNRYDG